MGLLQGGGAALKSGRVWMLVTTEGYRLTGQDPSQLGGVMAEYDHTWRAEFDASGRAEIAGLVPNAPLRVSVTAGSKRLVELADPITIPPGATREVELKVADTCKLSGIVRDDTGATVPDLTLWLLRADRSRRLHVEFFEGDERVGEAKTDAQGRFTIPKVSPGTWRLCPEAKMYRDGAPIPADAAAPIATLVEIPTGEGEHQVELVVHRGLTITGTVLDPDGKPVNNAGVGGFSSGIWFGSSCSAEGSFVLGPLAPGEYRLDADPSYHKELTSSEPVQAEAGARDVVLHLRSGGGLAGRVVDAATGEGVAAKIAVSQPGEKHASIYCPSSKADGAFRARPAAVGNLRARCSDGRRSRGTLARCRSGGRLPGERSRSQRERRGEAACALRG
ncbi:MAG: carboxypeptidase regulatory-like domain-containing protein [Planctomycetes bacterium]|nr:carboxypeptidase regulatory-like domain-containing protein [Planctomycetota bacterium]